MNGVFMKDKFKTAGYFVLAFVTCPCHLVFIVPLLAGTTLGFLLVDHFTIVRVIFTIVFGFFLYIGIYKILGKLFPSKAKTKESN